MVAQTMPGEAQYWRSQGLVSPHGTGSADIRSLRRTQLSQRYQLFQVPMARNEFGGIGHFLRAEQRYAGSVLAWVSKLMAISRSSSGGVSYQLSCLRVLRSATVAGRISPRDLDRIQIPLVEEVSAHQTTRRRQLLLGEPVNPSFPKHTSSQLHVVVGPGRKA